MITLLKIARANKMIEIKDKDKTIKLEAKAQESLYQLSPDLKVF